MEDDFGRFGFLEVFPISIVRDIAQRKNAGISSNSKVELIKKLLNGNFLDDEDYIDLMELSELIKEEKKNMSEFLSKLVEPTPELEKVYRKIVKLPYEYNSENEIVSKPGFGEVSYESDLLKFEYWYDIQKLQELPAGRIKREHKSEVLRTSINQTSKMISTSTKTVQKAVKLLKILKEVEPSFKTTVLTNSFTGDQSFKNFSEFINQVTSFLGSTNSATFVAEIPVRILTVEMYSPSGDVKTVVVNGRTDIFNHPQIVSLRPQGYKPIQIKGRIIFKDITFDFKIGHTVEQLGGDIAYISARQHTTASGMGGTLGEQLFEQLKAIYVNIFL